MSNKYFTVFPYFPEKEIDWILEEYRKILQGDGLLSMGKYVRQFEDEFKAYIGVDYSVATGSCTAALEIAFRTIGLKPGDEVVMPVETFIADASAVLREGGTPVFAEIDPETFCLSFEDFKKRITSRTKAVLLVHMAGLISPDVFEVVDYCRKRGIIVIEDAAHAHGAEIDNVNAGAIGDISCFSFGSTKIMAAGEAGMLLTKSEEYYKKANSLRNRGLDLSASFEAYGDIGSNSRLPEINAMLAIAQLRHLDEFVSHRNAVAGAYMKKLEALEGENLLSFIKVPENITHSYWRFILKLNERIDRNRVRDLMKEQGIPVDWAYFPPLHMQPVFKKMYGTREGMLPVSEKALSHHICLPVNLKVSTGDAELIGGALIECIRRITNG